MDGQKEFVTFEEAFEAFNQGHWVDVYMPEDNFQSSYCTYHKDELEKYPELSISIREIQHGKWLINKY